jgi:hypothetical protein
MHQEMHKLTCLFAGCVIQEIQAATEFQLRTKFALSHVV